MSFHAYDVVPDEVQSRITTTCVFTENQWLVCSQRQTGGKRVSTETQIDCTNS